MSSAEVLIDSLDWSHIQFSAQLLNKLLTDMLWKHFYWLHVIAKENRCICPTQNHCWDNKRILSASPRAVSQILVSSAEHDGWAEYSPEWDSGYYSLETFLISHSCNQALVTISGCASHVDVLFHICLWNKQAKEQIVGKNRDLRLDEPPWDLTRTNHVLDWAWRTGSWNRQPASPPSSSRSFIPTYRPSIW